RVSFFLTTSTAEISTLSLHDALPIYWTPEGWTPDAAQARTVVVGAAPYLIHVADYSAVGQGLVMVEQRGLDGRFRLWRAPAPEGDRKSTRLNSSHVKISYAVFCLKKK